MDIHLYNTATRRKELFAPLDPENVRMYVCGPTVYDRAHLGNARPVLVFDILYRLLKTQYPRVTYVRNFTDVDDKINARAAESGRSIGEITAETSQWFLDDMGAIGALEPDHMPRATAYIAEMVEMIAGLIEGGFAYAREGHVLFRVREYARYGALSGRSVDDMIAGARVEVAPYKEDPMDFVLWKPSDDQTPGWDSPWGRGRPGWHIECSAMAKALLGDRFDIHGGGNDLMFPHHENEIAQSCCANGTDRMANVWMHNEMLQVEGKKMSKSLGNFFTVRDLLEQGVPGEVIRFVMLSTHYRKPMDWTAEKAEEAAQTLFKWRSLSENTTPASETSEAVVSALSNDLNTPQAIAELYKLEVHPRALLRNARLLGLLEPNNGEWYSRRKLQFAANDTLKVLLLKRKQAKIDKKFDIADQIRDALKVRGISLEDLPEGLVKPSISFDFVSRYISGLTELEKKEVFGDIYKDDGSLDGSSATDRYLERAAKEVLFEIEGGR
ncbi:cysteine--tRNA ligase [uncultured Pseudosulfitobacter sp.]|mgnify:FL=1|uniref:cysteine--tRNA ligase n=1 Tax=uncultured Pseudosulfitobacter sp. TaxID=2854214 RepID=UPI0030D71CC9|tara:strand:- start:70 stop:1563 length:1494 start_codon:yes stop_codon:yes gene_type:complete